MISGSAGGTLSPSNDKRRNKLGYQRTSVACSHCRRRKIRCLPASPEDSAGRCANCIRLKKDCTFFPVDHGATSMRAESAQSPPLEEPAIISLPAPEELPSQLPGASSRSYSTPFLPTAVTNGLAIQPPYMLPAEHEGWQSPPFPHAEASPYWGSGESTPNPPPFQQMPELTPTSSGPPFVSYPQQQWGQRSASYGQIEGVHHGGFAYPPELAAAAAAAAATDLTAASLQYSIPAPHPHLAGPPAAAPGFAFQQPQAWIAQPQPGVSPWFSEPSPLTELDLNEQEVADPFAGTVSPVYPNRQSTS